MDIITITPDARKAITALILDSILVEYDMIVGYPRIIDHLVNFEKITDKQLIEDISNLGRDSLGHFQRTDALLARMGAEKTWRISMLPRLVGVIDELEKQKAKEIYARDAYKEARLIASRDKTKIRGRQFFGRTFRVKSGEDEDIVSADDIIQNLERLIQDEERHARNVEDSIATLKYLSKK